MSLRDFNEPSGPLNSFAAGNGTGLSSFHTTHPEVRQPSHIPQIAGALIVVLMVGAAAVGLYAYSGSPHPKQEVANNSLQQPPASPPAPPVQSAAANANMPADMTTPATAATANNSTPDSAPTNEAPSKPTLHHRRTASNVSGESSSATSSTGATTPLPAAPQPSPSDVATNNNQTGQAMPQSSATASDTQDSAAPQPTQPAAPQPDAPAQQSAPQVQ